MICLTRTSMLCAVAWAIVGALPMRAADTQGLRCAIDDLASSFPEKYPRAAEFLQRLDALEKKPDDAAFAALQREALLANPLLDFDRLLLVKRRDNNLGLPQNWQGNCSLSREGYDNEIAVL